MSNLSGYKIILVCTDCDNTRILYHGIKKDIPVSHIITEQPVSKKWLIKRRIKKLGIVTVTGQLIFQAGIVPLIRKLSGRKVKKILTERQLDISALPADKLIAVPSVNDAVFIQTIRSLDPDLV